MNLLAMLDSIEARGITMLPDGEQIRIRPAGALTDTERRAIMSNRPIVLELLRRRHDPANAIAIPCHPIKPPAADEPPVSPEYAPAHFESAIEGNVIVYGPWIVPTTAAYASEYETAQRIKQGERIFLALTNHTESDLEREAA